MLTLSIEDLIVELEDGAVKHVGPKTTDATVKLYHVEESEARTFGDRQVKLGFADGEGNEVEVALDRDVARSLADDLQAVADDASDSAGDGDETDDNGDDDTHDGSPF